MKKTLLALSLAGGFLGAAHAQSSVTIYGNVDLGLVKKSDTTLAVGKRDANGLGFKGVEDLGGGLKALFQLEIRYEPDTGTLESVTRPLFQGQSRVGLQGDFGMVRLGRGLAASMETLIGFEPFHGLPSAVGFYTDIQVAGFTQQPLDAAGNSFNRMSNAVFYNSPEFSGFQVNVTVASKEPSSPTGPAIVGRSGNAALPQYPAGAEASANPISASGTYKNGAVAAALTYDRNAIETKLWTASASLMATPGLKLMGTYASQDKSHTVNVNNKTRSWDIGANLEVGSGKFLAGLGQKSPDGALKSKEYSLGYEYSLSKRTYVYTDISNKKIATTVNQYDVGVRHSF